MQIVTRPVAAADTLALWREGVTPVLARALAGRGINSTAQIAGPLGQLEHHSCLASAGAAAAYLADVIADKKHIRVVADFDCDGATACTVAVRGLRAYGASVDYLVPDRMIHGYGLTPSIVDIACDGSMLPTPDVLLTVDNGIASYDGILRATELGVDVVVTDHHLPAAGKPLPAARIIVDPSQPGDTFKSKSLAGCGVIWYVLWALQDELRARGMPIAPGFKVSDLLPFVAVGTIADVVSLDRNNRILVEAGLERIRRQRTYPGLEELATVGFNNPCDPRKLITTDVAFGIGPRINAAGRLKSMSQGIECLLTDDAERAREMARELNAINQERKEIEFDIVVAAFEQAMDKLDAMSDTADRFTLVVHDATWHAGVIGIVAGRIKERLHRPTFVLTTVPETGEVKGSGRSVPGVNLKDILDQVDKEAPGLMKKFGGHAMAAGLTLRAGGFELFRDTFEKVARRLVTPEQLEQVIHVDGSLSGQDLSLHTLDALRTAPWGQGFLEPAFYDTFTVVKAKLGGVHKDQLDLVLERDGTELRATRFRHDGPVPAEGDAVQIIYKLSSANSKKDGARLKLLIDHIVA